MPMRKLPKPDGRDEREPDAQADRLRVLRSSAISREARTTPTTAAAIPTACAALGRSPVATPTITGSAAPVAEIGATMLIVPIASAW